jgi:choline dehydrogenase-like flavoprotein
LRVVLLEAGPEPTQLGDGRWETPGPAVDRLGPVRMAGEDPYPNAGGVDGTRGAGLGGTALCWSVRLADLDDDPETVERGCRYGPLDPIDLEARADVGHDGWPIKRAELDEWYPQAQQVAGIGAFAYSPESWSAPDAQPLDLAPGTVTSAMFQVGPASAFIADAAGRLRADPKVRFVMSAVVTEVTAEAEGGEVTGVRFVTDAGGRLQRGEVRARAVVLAAGGIENPRLLLLSDTLVRGGLGNAHGQVGRYFMEHPFVRGGMLAVDPAGRLPERLRLYDLHRRDGTFVVAKLTLTEETVRARGLVSTSLLVQPRHRSLVSGGVLAYQAMHSPSAVAAGHGRQARLALRAGLGAPSLIRARRAIEQQPNIDYGGWSRRPGAAGVKAFEILHQTEQTPDPENRVELRDTLDVFGRRTAVLHWRWGAADRDRIARARDVYAAAFAAAGYGTMLATDWDAGRPRMLSGNHHHLGGTRMAVDPRVGVVDVDCRVHGLRNLFVAGSSVFPAGGSVNPTLTIIALALRLATHIKGTGLFTTR